MQKVCFGENSTSPTTAMPLISTGLRSIESLAFDWSSKNLYWVDAGARKIEVAREDGRYRKELFNSTYLDRPRALVLDPRFGWVKVSTYFLYLCSLDPCKIWICWLDCTLYMFIRFQKIIVYYYQTFLIYPCIYIRNVYVR